MTIRQLSSWAAFAITLCVLLTPLGTSSAPATGGAGGGGGGSAPASNAGSTITAPTSSIISGFPAFYVVADGQEPLFQAYGTEAIAYALSQAYLVRSNAPPNIYFVAAIGWTEDTLSKVCQSDPNAIGGLIVKYTAFFTQGNWLAFTTESEHIQPQFILVSCANQVASHVTPAITVLTEKSPSQVTFPISYITALSTLFTFHGSTTSAYQVKYGYLVLATSLGGLSGNVGLLNPGHEAVKVAGRVANDAVKIVDYVCERDQSKKVDNTRIFPKKTELGNYKFPDGSDLYDIAGTSNPGMTPEYEVLTTLWPRELIALKTASALNLSAWNTAPSPAPSYNPLAIAIVPPPTPTPRRKIPLHPGPTPTPSPQPTITPPLGSVCQHLGFAPPSAPSSAFLKP